MGTPEDFMGPGSGCLPCEPKPRPENLCSLFDTKYAQWDRGQCNRLKQTVKSPSFANRNMKIPLLDCNVKKVLMPYQKKAVENIQESLFEKDPLKIFVCDMEKGTGKTLIMTALIATLCYDGVYRDETSKVFPRKAKVLTICKRETRRTIHADRQSIIENQPGYFRGADTSSSCKFNQAVKIPEKKNGTTHLYAYDADSQSSDSINWRKLQKRLTEFSEYSPGQEKYVVVIMDEPQEIIQKYETDFYEFFDFLKTFTRTNLKIRLVLMSADFNNRALTPKESENPQTAEPKIRVLNTFYRYIAPTPPAANGLNITLLQLKEIPVKNKPCVILKHCDMYGDNQNWEAVGQLLNEELFKLKDEKDERGMVAFESFEEGPTLIERKNQLKLQSFICLNDFDTILELNGLEMNKWTEEAATGWLIRFVDEYNLSPPGWGTLAIYDESKQSNSFLLHLFGTKESVKHGMVPLGPHRFLYQDLLEMIRRRFVPIDYLFIDHKCIGIDPFMVKRIFLMGSFESSTASQLAARAVRYCNVQTSPLNPTYPTIEIVFVNWKFKNEKQDLPDVFNADVLSGEHVKPLEALATIVPLTNDEEKNQLHTSEKVLEEVLGEKPAGFQLFKKGDALTFTESELIVQSGRNVFGYKPFGSKTTTRLNSILTDNQIETLRNHFLKGGKWTKSVEEDVGLYVGLRLQTKDAVYVHVNNIKPQFDSTIAQKLTEKIDMYRSLINLSTTSKSVLTIPDPFPRKTDAVSIATLIHLVPICSPQAFDWFSVVSAYHANPNRRILYESFVKYMVGDGGPSSVANPGIQLDLDMVIRIVDVLVPARSDKFGVWKEVYKHFSLTDAELNVYSEGKGGEFPIESTELTLKKEKTGRETPLSLLIVDQVKKSFGVQIKYDNGEGVTRYIGLKSTDHGDVCISVPSNTVIDVCIYSTQNSDCSEIIAKFNLDDHTKKADLASICELLQSDRREIVTRLSTMTPSTIDFVRRMCVFLKHRFGLLPNPQICAIIYLANKYNISFDAKMNVFNSLSTYYESKDSKRFITLLLMSLRNIDLFITQVVKAERFQSQNKTSTVFYDAIYDHFDKMIETIDSDADSDPFFYKEAELHILKFEICVKPKHRPSLILPQRMITEATPVGTSSAASARLSATIGMIRSSYDKIEKEIGSIENFLQAFAHYLNYNLYDANVSKIWCREFLKVFPQNNKEEKTLNKIIADFVQKLPDDPS